MRLVFVQLLIVWLSCGLVFAQASQPAYELPKGVQVELGKKELRAFTVDEFKIILHIWADYRKWRQSIPDLDSQIRNLTLVSRFQAQQLVSQDQARKILNSERQILTAKWEKENRQRHLCESKPRFGSWIPWAVAAVAVGAASALGIVIAVK